MTEFTLGNYRLAVDVEATRAYYTAHHESWITCQCAGCRNFAQAVRKLPQAVGDFFETLVLDPEKAGELCYYNGTEHTIIGDGWAALSTDGSQGYVKLEANNCKVQTILSGYGAYADGMCHDFFNNCDFDVADQAGIMAGECDMTFNDCTAVCGSYFAHIHCVMGMPAEVGTLKVKDCVINTGKDAVSIRSQNAIVDIERSDIIADNGVLVHSIVNTDPNATKTGGKRVYGIHVYLRDSELEGAILHEDPDREMNVYLEKASLVGAIQGAILHFDGESTWTATNASHVTIVGEVDMEQIDAPGGVTITADCDQEGTYTLASGGTLVLKKA